MSKLFIEDTTLTAIGDAIREKTGTSDLIAPLDMPTAIGSISGGGGGDIEVEPIVLTSNQQYGCSGAMASTYIKLFGDTITTNGITSANYMFANYKNETIPFEINMDASNYRDMAYFFQGAQNLKELPKINNAYPSYITQFFSNCIHLRNIPDDYFDDWNFSRLQSSTYGNCGSIFSGCNSLRKIPKHFLNNMWGIQTSSTYNFYNGAFSYCYALDEIKGLGVSTAILVSNVFLNMVQNCWRLKDFTFDTNEDGTPKTAQWRGQTIDLSGYSGYGQSLYKNQEYLTRYNSGITADKEVKDDATYQALKDDPDWFSYDVAYSRYNHDSAVRTINSLPDCSAYLASAGGTNTIKFKGAMSSATDGGAINTLTEEEIAVAAAKGWTVSLK